MPVMPLLPSARRRIGWFGVVVVIAATLSSCGGTTTPSTTTVPGVVPTPAEQAATLAATNAYRSQIVNAATSFNTAVRALATDLQQSKTGAAIAAWRVAEQSFDGLRPELSGGPATWSQLSGPVRSDGSGGGLQSVAFGLFHGPTSVAADASPGLVLAGATYAIGVFRTIVQPSTIAAHQVENLGYLVTTCLGGNPEPWSHEQALDVRAVAAGVISASSALIPLARLVVPGPATLLRADLAGLAQAVGELGSDDGVLTSAETRAIATKATILQGVLGQIAGAFAGYSNGRYFA